MPGPESAGPGLDPRRSGRGLAAFFLAVEPALWNDLAEAGALPAGPPPLARREWECFALYACVRGLVAAGGFGERTSIAVDELHEAVLEQWAGEASPPEPLADRTARIAERYAEFGRTGQESESAAPASVRTRLGELAARHMCAPGEPGSELVAMVAELHEAMAEGAAEVVRRAGT